MAKEKSDKDKEERKREKKERKEKRSEKDGVHKSKKEKKVTEAALAENDNVATKLLNKLEEEKPGSVAIKENGGVEVKVKTAPILGALVPFANPLADEKVGKKVLKSVKKGETALRPLMAEHALTHTLHNSRQEQIPQARRQRSRQISPQIHHARLFLQQRCPRRRYPCRRYLAHGCHIAYTGTLRGSWGSVYLCAVEGGVGSGGEYEEADECGDGQCEECMEEEGGGE